MVGLVAKDNLKMAKFAIQEPFMALQSFCKIKFMLVNIQKCLART